MSHQFLSAYIRTAAACIGNDFADNYDVDRFGRRPLPIRIAQRAATLASATGVLRASTARHLLESALALVEPHGEELGWLYAHLVDEESRQTLLAVLAFRALGHRRVKLPVNTAQYRATLDTLRGLADKADAIEAGFDHWRLQRTDLTSLGYPLRLYAPPTGLLYAFLLQQYRCRLPRQVIAAAAGDVVLDAGACWGETALYFAHQVGAAGRVYAFEFVAQNLAILRRNLGLNPDLAARIQVVEQALWEKTGESLAIERTGPASRVVPRSDQPAARLVETLAIDDFVDREGLPRVDFIKMDIEGAELPALQGADQTIRRCNPGLAISVYHDLRDFWTIPQWLTQLGMGHRFALRHFTIHKEETMLFAATAPD